MDETRLLRSLDRVDDLGEPDPAFLGRLYDQALTELGFDDAGRPAAGRDGPGRPRLRPLRGARTRWPLVVIAALVGGGLLATLGVGALRNRQPDDHADLLTQVRGAGRITIAVRADHPQFAVGGEPAAGFDVDIARELARRLGVTPDVIVVNAGTMLSPLDTTPWSMALPSVPAWTIPGSGFVASGAYYAWPHLVVVQAGSPATATAQVGPGAVCAVSGDGGEAWLRGAYGGAPAAETGATIVTRPSDDECLAMIASGEAVAAVTADLTQGDLVARGGLRTLDGPTPEPRVVIVRAGSTGRADPSSLVASIDAALDAMRADGTLTRFSENGFGADLTNP